MAGSALGLGSEKRTTMIFLEPVTAYVCRGKVKREFWDKRRIDYVPLKSHCTLSNSLRCFYPACSSRTLASSLPKVEDVL